MSPERIVAEQQQCRPYSLTFNEWYELNKLWLPNHSKVWLEVVWNQAQENK